MNYITERIFPLNKPRKVKTRSNRYKHNLPEYIHLVNTFVIRNGVKHDYWKYKVHIKRSGKSKIKYFKTLMEAQTFVEMLRINRYI